MRKILGIICILFSILGGLLPFIPGFVFFFIGIALISPKLEVKLKKIHQNYENHKSLKKTGKELYRLFLSTFTAV